MSLALVMFILTLLELWVLKWGLKLGRRWTLGLALIFLVFLLPLPYLAWLIQNGKLPGFWVALFIIRPSFAWHFNWLAFLVFIAPIVVFCRLCSIIFHSNTFIKFSRIMVILVILFWGLVSIYGLAMTIKAPIVEKYELSIKGLSPKDDGLRIVQLSDLHISWWTSKEEVDRVSKLVSELNPDLLLITGDIVDHNPEFVRELGESFKELHPRLGKFAIIGNHDVYTGAEQIVERMKAINFKMLGGECFSLINKGADLALAGMDDSGERWTGADPREKEIPKILDQCHKGLPIIWLGHRSSGFEQIKGLPVALTLTGHTHGGQLRLPFGGPGLAHLRFNYTAGLYQENGQFLYVSRGIGTVGWPFRIACPPEITLIVLGSGQ